MEIWSKLTTYASSCAVNHTHTVPVGRRFCKNCFRKNCWEGSSVPKLLFFHLLFPLNLDFSKAHLSHTTSNPASTKKKKTKNKTKKPTRRIIAQSKIAFNTSLHVFLGFQNSMMGTHLRAPSFSHPSCLAAQIHSESLLLSFSVQWCNGTASAVVKKVPIIPGHCCFLCDRCFLDTWAGERSWFRLLISSHERDVVLNGHVSLKRKKEKKSTYNLFPVRVPGNLTVNFVN